VLPVAQHDPDRPLPAQLRRRARAHIRALRHAARALRSLGEAPGTAPDPFDAGASVGGYCTYLGGKFTGSAGRPGFDAGVRGGGRRLGRMDCTGGGAGQTPRCGTEREASYRPEAVPFVRDVLEFMDAMLYRAPGGGFRVQPFFVWYAPRIPHQPLDAPLAIRQHLFGGDQAGLGGLFDLGGYCANGVCPPWCAPSTRTTFGTVREFYANVWWGDDNLRELRKLLERASTPHCRGRDGRGRYDIGTPAACSGTWADVITPAPNRNTVIIHMSDNGWHLPDSKHNFSENGYRTRMIVFDPRTLPEAPAWHATGDQRAHPYESPAVAHSTDVLPTVLGLALDTPGAQACPESADGTRCDGRDLRSQLVTAPGGRPRRRRCAARSAATRPSAARALAAPLSAYAPGQRRPLRQHGTAGVQRRRRLHRWAGVHARSLCAGGRARVRQ